jgi:hypothetical protein
VQLVGLYTYWQCHVTLLHITVHGNQDESKRDSNHPLYVLSNAKNKQNSNQICCVSVAIFLMLKTKGWTNFSVLFSQSIDPFRDSCRRWLALFWNKCSPSRYHPNPYHTNRYLLLLFLWGPSSYTSGSTSALWLIVLSPVLDLPTSSTSSPLPRPLIRESWSSNPVI